MTTPLTTLAQRLWRDDVLTGRRTVKEVLRTFCHAVEEADFPRQIESMPDEMFVALTGFVSPISVEGGGVDWPTEALSITNLELDAFNSDFDATLKWKRHRLELIYSAIRLRLRNQ